PELSFRERRTTGIVRDRLAALGLTPLPCPTETGAFALLRGGRPGRTVLLRADIDALPIVEESGEPFTSEVQGRMHACGHDAHVAMMLAAARLLAARAEDLPGSYLFVFQPAEEIISGARAMLDGGLLDGPPGPSRHGGVEAPAAAIGLHIFSQLASGSIAARPGLQWAGADAFEVRFTGPGGHGGMMGRFGNVIAAQSFLVERLESVVEGLEHEGTRCHVVAGLVESDGAFNVVPRRVRVQGGIRSLTADLREESLDRLRGLLLETETEFGVSAELDLRHRTIPLVNDAAATATVLEVARAAAGPDAVIELPAPMTVSDDMAEFLDRIPGCYFVLGAAPPGAAPPPAHHAPDFRIDEAAMPLGVSVLAGAAVALARQPA
ncbi:MAG TPA: amidohydrolase, partial [Candidatus Dormibacteraeota bacterium]|nr:amidohydrolase [Candidatus Dormibacteraeota bacterium]